MRIVSYLAPNLFWLYEAVGDYLGRVLEKEVQTFAAEADPLTDSQLAEEGWEGCFICGLPLMRLDQAFPGQLRPLVAPVMQADRYGDRPIYFSDVIVRADSSLRAWEDLSQTVFCYNDTGSHSGYNLMRYHLLQRGQVQGFFRQVVQSEAHLRSLQWILAGKADCTAIDSTVFERALTDKPELRDQLRVITSLGPSPMPPFAVSQRLEPSLQETIRQALCRPDACLQRSLARAGVRRFAPVELADYQPVLELHRAALAANREFICDFKTAC
ncbi:PhnD/SsuA/transferrin family substrate-binding protein [Pseudanabaena sp. FACHB-2040]|uniref:phosphate/phosphite/phosphonate ABC transporter substrate-binding protein n=1 Tax=Pseudanabaena sp. FACHB-2040 TaxID=2692859 RepID=UPI0016896C50|nr:PhnD/SsuA/transferrin family substrate-binding protein [Pseudanabaena sp. FACHB-2040]MBD2258267.1 PhnD/SsuA/transferrin family substrate-binding protein [Pseudanabaena sp. FACHB-2040]